MQWGSALFFDNEVWLMERVLGYAKRQGYTQYTSTLLEAWRASIVGLNKALEDAVQYWGDTAPEFTPGNEIVEPISNFAVLEARRHRERGVSLGMFLALLKYYRQAYFDLVEARIEDPEERTASLYFVLRFYDCLEVALCVEWIGTDNEKRLTELQRANRDITNEKNKYLTMFESLADPALLLDGTGKINTVNRAAASMLGMGEIPGAIYYAGPGEGVSKGAEHNMAFDMDILQQRNPWLVQVLQAAREESCRAEGDARFRVNVDLSGEERWFDVNCTPMLDVSGKFTGAVVVLSDITRKINIELELEKSRWGLEHRVRQRTAELEKANSRLLDSEREYRFLVENLQEGIWLLGPDGVTQFVNPRMEEMLGYVSGEMIGKRIADFLRPEERAKAEQLQGMAYGERRDVQCGLQRRDGSKVDVQMALSPACDDEGACRGVLAGVMDITERKLTEERLRRSEYSLAEAQRIAQLGSWEWNIDHDDLEWSAQTYRIFGLSPDSKRMTYERFLTFVHPEDRKKLADSVREGKKNGGYEVEHRIMHADGQERYLVERGEVVANLNGAMRMVGTVQDITERRHGEEMLRAAKEEAEAANEAKSKFLGNMSHELRTPLNGIMGMNQLLRASELQPDQREMLELSLECSQRLLRIINDLLDLSSIETGTVTLRKHRFSLRSTLAAILNVFSEKCCRRGVGFSWKLDESLPDELLGDDDRIRQVLVNIVGNAVKFTQKGSIRVHIVRLDGNGGKVWVGFNVSDTGIGIPGDKLEGIFDSFVLGEDYLTKRYGGSGLGLSISKSIVEQMGGSISVESIEGRGSHFCVQLPLERIALDLETARKTAASQRTENVNRPFTILVVEDEPVNRLITSRILERNGHVVRTASDGWEALEMLADDWVDLVLMDLQMPRLNGLQAARMIRDGERGVLDPSVPIVACTAFADEQDRQGCKAAGMDGYLSKPFEVEQLQAAVLRHARFAEDRDARIDSEVL